MFRPIQRLFTRAGRTALQPQCAIDSVRLTIRGEDDRAVAGADLVAWVADRLGGDISDRLMQVAAELRESTVQVPLAHLCVGPKRIGSWRQSWKVVSNASVTFQVALVVEDRDPEVLLLRMTSYPQLQFPPLRGELADLVRRHAGIEMTEATNDLDEVELRGRSYSIRPHLIWNPSAAA